MIPGHKPGLRRLAATLLTAAAGVFASGVALAAYPDKPVRIVVGFSAGGTTDVIARIMAKELTESLGQSFVVENKPGAGSNIATDQVQRAAPDGYTLLFVAVTSAINQTLYKNVNFDLTRDFAPVALGAKVPNILVVNPQVPVKTVQELVDYAKKNPGKLAFASSGSGTSIHMAGELFKMQTGIDVLHVPYKGSAPAITDLIGGQVQFMFDNMPGMAARAVGQAARAGGDDHRALQERAGRADHEGSWLRQFRRVVLVRPDRPGRHAARGHQQAQRRHGEGTGQARGAAQLRAAGRRGREDHACRVRPVHQVGSGRLGPGGQGLGRQVD